VFSIIIASGAPAVVPLKTPLQMPRAAELTPIAAAAKGKKL